VPSAPAPRYRALAVPAGAWTDTITTTYYDGEPAAWTLTRAVAAHLGQRVDVRTTSFRSLRWHQGRIGFVSPAGEPRAVELHWRGTLFGAGLEETGLDLHGIDLHGIDLHHLTPTLARLADTSARLPIRRRPRTLTGPHRRPRAKGWSRKRSTPRPSARTDTDRWCLARTPTSRRSSARAAPGTTAHPARRVPPATRRCSCPQPGWPPSSPSRPLRSTTADQARGEAKARSPHACTSGPWPPDLDGADACAAPRPGRRRRSRTASRLILLP